jgi:hypothetical protein
MPTTATPVITQVEAEMRARTEREHDPGEIGELLQARLVSVTASRNASSLQGRQVWMLAFAFLPPGTQSGPLPPALQHMQYQAQVLVDAQDGLTIISCAGLLPRPSTP